MSTKGPLRKFVGLAYHGGIAHDMLECGHGLIAGCRGKRKAIYCEQCQRGAETIQARYARYAEQAKKGR